MTRQPSKKAENILMGTIYFLVACSFSSIIYSAWLAYHHSDNAQWFFIGGFGSTLFLGRLFR
jgi:hypothetical protein